jgi:ferredoxin
MADRAVTKEQLLDALMAASAGSDVYVPVAEGGRVEFTKMAEGTDVALASGISTRSPKDFFFPPSEVMLRYERTGRGMELQAVAPAPERPVVLFGVRPCGGRALTLLDRLFAPAEETGDYRDPSYVARRDNTTVVGLACADPLSTCFCASTGGDPYGTEGLDALVSDLGDGTYCICSFSDKGAALIGSMGTEATDEHVNRSEQRRAEARAAVASDIPVPAVIEKLTGDLKGAFENSVWDRFHEKCLGCTACAFLCPTCHCFNIADESTLSGGRRVRTWDCCMMPLFTKHVSGHNPRESTRERMRQRMMHKFLYFVSNFGDSACVGCGRCVRACPVNNDMRDVLKTIAATEIAPRQVQAG